jgi:hypothetical protein
MTRTPHALSDELRVSGNANNARFPQVYLWLFNSRHLLEIKDGGVKKEEGSKIDAPGNGVSHRIMRQVVKDNPVVSVRNKEGNPGIGQTQGGKGENDTPSAGSYDGFAIFAQTSQARVHERKDDSIEERRDVGIAVSKGIFQKVLKVVAISSTGVDPKDGNGSQDKPASSPTSKSFDRSDN